jgi:IclR family transcriptional regulator, pca regulon regulatory protein
MDGGQDTRDSRSGDFVEALAKGIAVIESFDAQHPDMTLSDIARRTGTSPAAARRSLLTLMALGYVGQAGKRFHLTPKVMILGGAFYSSARVDEVLGPEVRHIVETFGDACSVAVLVGQEVLYIAHASASRARRASAVVGARYPAFATSLGRVLLAGLPEPALDGLSRSALEPQRLTNRTLIDKDELRCAIASVRDEGYATTVDQLDYGITALAVPIRGPDGRTVAALNSSGYTGMVTPDDMIRDRLAELRATASRIGASVARYPVLGSVLGTA